MFVTYLFMCATEGQAFDDLFVIIFISSQEKFSPTNQINTLTSLSLSIKGRAPQRDISYSANRHVLWSQVTNGNIGPRQKVLVTEAPQNIKHENQVKAKMQQGCNMDSEMEEVVQAESAKTQQAEWI